MFVNWNLFLWVCLSVLSRFLFFFSILEFRKLPYIAAESFETMHAKLTSAPRKRKDTSFDLKLKVIGGGFAPQFRTKVAMVRFWNKESWRLWFGIWVLYFHRMLNITYQVLEVDWPLTLSAKIGGHVTWVVCYLPPMEIMEFWRIADVLSAVFQLDQHFLS